MLQDMASSNLALISGLKVKVTGLGQVRLQKSIKIPRFSCYQLCFFHVIVLLGQLLITRDKKNLP